MGITLQSGSAQLQSIDAQRKAGAQGFTNFKQNGFKGDITYGQPQIEGRQATGLSAYVEAAANSDKADNDPTTLSFAEFKNAFGFAPGTSDKTVLAAMQFIDRLDGSPDTTTNTLKPTISKGAALTALAYLDSPPVKLPGGGQGSTEEADGVITQADRTQHLNQWAALQQKQDETSLKQTASSVQNWASYTLSPPGTPIDIDSTSTDSPGFNDFPEEPNYASPQKFEPPPLN
ncbi:MAG: hypothetical protein VKJ06_02260 [Vampirovibrionales bacterium]|nr:hypothetical protein [Vampirovibrionales bacterium]